jgi:hypothetical protein
MKLTWELHELSSGFSAILYDEHGQAIDTHLTEQQAKTIAHRVNCFEELVAALGECNKVLSALGCDIAGKSNIAEAARKARAALKRAKQ